jgi:cell division protein FtsZ
MSINLKIPDIRELKPRITVFGVGGAGGNAVNNMIAAGLQGVDFVVANTDAQALTTSRAERIIQMGVQATEGLGAGSQPDVGCTAAQEVIDEIRDHLAGAHMVFVTAGMGGGTGTGASPVVAKVARDLGILTVGVVTKPFHFEGQRRMRLAEDGIKELQKVVDTLIIIPNQNLFRVANEKTTFADAFAMADQVLYSGVACITDLMVKEGLINLDFADVRAVMREMGKAMMGTGEASGEKRALRSAEAAICNPLIDDVSMRGARGVLISITGGKDLTLYEVDEAATRIREEVDLDANIIVGATFDESLDGIIRVSVVATGVDLTAADTASASQGGAPGQPAPRAPSQPAPGGTRSEHHESRIAELAQRLKADHAQVAGRMERTGQPASRAAGGTAPMQPPLRPSVDQAATAAVAAALSPDADGVSVRPMAAKPGVFVEQQDGRDAGDPAMPRAFIPPQPERPMSRSAPRMPTFEELPLPGQAEYRARHGGGHEAEHPEKRRMTLLQRLAAVGLGRKEDDVDPRGDLRTSGQMPSQVQGGQMHPGQMPAAERPALRGPARPADPALDPAKRGAPQVDVRGRSVPLPSQPDDDQLDIPAFLRRQANL